MHQATIKELNNSFNQVKNSLYQTLLNETTITKDSLINQLGLLQTKIERTHYNHFKEIKSICLPNQLANFNELSKELSTFFSPDKKNRNQPQD
jgi:protein CpxP